MGSSRKNIGEQSELGDILEGWGKDGHPFPSPDYLSALFARRFYFWARTDFLSFFPQCGVWSQANFIHNPRLRSHKLGNMEFEAPDLWLLTRSLLTHVSLLR